jgi:4a-hydroxytetrahydrobiopterin dehydratase
MWKEENNKLKCHLKFKDFKTAIAFINKVAEEMNHHPSWCNTYNIIDIELTTHSAGNTITQQDHELAFRIDYIYNSFSSNSNS